MDIGQDRPDAVTAVALRHGDEVGADLVADDVVVEVLIAMGLGVRSGNGHGVLPKGGSFDVER